MPKSSSVALAVCAALTLAASAWADPSRAENAVDVTVINAKGVGAKIGTLTFVATKHGLEIIPDLRGLPPGLHGFHLHQHPNCGGMTRNGKMMPGLAAGGHRADLGLLAVAADGSATLPVLAPRLTPRDLAGHALIIHAGADIPSGDGARIACAVVTGGKGRGPDRPR